MEWVFIVGWMKRLVVKGTDAVDYLDVEMRHRRWWGRRARQELFAVTAVVGDQTMTAASAAGSKARSVSFQEAGVLQGGKVGVGRKIASP